MKKYFLFAGVNGAGKIAVSMINECLLGEDTFNQETTLSGLKDLHRIQQAKKNGFYVTMYYVGLESKELAVERVANRVKKGGHDVPRENIESRHLKSLKNLKKCINLVDEIEIHDNSGTKTRMIYYSKDGVELFKALNMPKWAKEILE